MKNIFFSAFPSGIIILRIALSSHNVTPGGSVEIADILGKDESIARLTKAKEWIN